MTPIHHRTTSRGTRNRRIVRTTVTPPDATTPRDEAGEWADQACAGDEPGTRTRPDPDSRPRPDAGDDIPAASAPFDFPAPPAGDARGRHAAVDSLLRRTRLAGGISRDSFRVAGVPVLIAAVISGGPGWTTYVVRPGDSLAGIARRYGADVRALARVNGLTGDDLPAVGRRLSVPVPAESGTAAKSTPVRQKAAATGLHPVDTSGAPALTYRVRDGDTIAGIADRTGASVRAVLAANNLRPTGVIKPGQLLVLPVLNIAGPPVVQPAQGLTSQSVAAAAAANRAALARRVVPSRTQVRELIRESAQRYHVNPALALAVASMESGFDQRQVSPANAIGVMQVLPSSGAWAGDLLRQRLDLLDAADNVAAGLVLLASLLRQGDEQTALAGYYQGLSSVRQNGLFADTRRYVATVRTLKLRFR